MIKYRIIKNREEFLRQIESGSLRDVVLKGVDLTSVDQHINWSVLDVNGAAFIGCTLKTLEEEFHLRKRGALVMPPIPGLPYDPFRDQLYTPEELMQGYDQDSQKDSSLDHRIEMHFEDRGGHDPDIVEAMSQMLHDYSIDQAIKDLLGVNATSGLPARKAVGIMGGHLVRRDDPYYAKTAELAAKLTRNGYFITCGGGPGIMEAANFGAYMANESSAAFLDALAILQKEPNYQGTAGGINPGYIRQAQAVRERYPNGAESLAVPTWFYGHEPVNMFASHIAKYFSNSLREDGLLAISIYGVVYAPGSAATIQEVFTDAAQNHYATFDFISPMVFLGSSHYLQSQVYACLAQQAAGHAYAQLITISDNCDTLIDFINEHPPLKVAHS